MKKISVLLALILVLVMFASCAKDKETEAASVNDAVEENEPLKIGYLLGDLVNEFYLQMIDGGEQAAIDYGGNIELIIQGVDMNVEKEVNLMENFILQGVDAIVMDPMDAEGVITVCNQAAAAGIPVITTANLVNANENYMTLYPDKANIRTMTEALCYAIGKEGKLGLLSGDVGSWVLGQREEGFMEAIAQFPNIEGDIQLTKYDTAVAATITENWINTSGIDGIAVITNPYARASITAAKNLGAENDIVWAGLGGIENVDLMAEGHQIIDHLLGGYTVGYWNIAAAIRILRGEEIPKKLYLATPVVMTDEKAEWLKGLGFDSEYITPEVALELSTTATTVYGPQVSLEEFIGDYRGE